MSFLGNDFLPSSLGLKMRDDGHDVLMDLVAYLNSINTPLLDEKDQPNLKGLEALFKSLAASEERRVLGFVQKKIRQGLAYKDAELPVGDPNWAMAQGEENCLLDGKDWRSVYRDRLHRVDGVRAYLTGLAWIWNYYRGVPVCYNWYYPWNLPPLWIDLEQAVQDSPGYVRAIAIAIGANDILTAEQLCLVLPPASWDLIPTVAAVATVATVAIQPRSLQTVAPYYFPSSFEFCSLGKRWFWECEPKIPIPSILEVKRLLA